MDMSPTNQLTEIYFGEFIRDSTANLKDYAVNTVNILGYALQHRRSVFVIFGAFWVSALVLLPFVGQDFFPQVDAGQFRLHVRAPAGTRVEETERIFAQVAKSIRQVIPPEELEIILDNIGLPVGGINLAFSDSATIGAGDGEILVALKEGKHHPTGGYIKELRQKLAVQFPQLTFFFQPSDIVTQILNFGLPAPVDVQVIEPAKNRQDNFKIAKQLKTKIAQVPGTVDVHLHQVIDAPELRINVDRSQAQNIGLTQRDVANTLLTSLSSSAQTSPNYWLDPIKGVNYLLAVQVPQSKITSLEQLNNTPITNGSNSELLSNLSVVKRGTAALVVNHYNVQPVFDVYASVQGRELGGVAKDIYKIVGEFKQK